jgi:hypothetical protein
MFDIVEKLETADRISTPTYCHFYIPGQQNTEEVKWTSSTSMKIFKAKAARRRNFVISA